MRIRYTRGFTLLELVIAISIASLLFIAVFVLVGRGFTINRELIEQNRITEDARINVRRLARLIQAAQAPADSSWIITSGPYEMVFLAELDDDPELEQVRIFLEGTELKQVVTQLDRHGRPIAGSEQATTLAVSVRNQETQKPIFTLHTAISSLYPTLVDITLVVDVMPQTAPDATTIQTATAPRNVLYPFLLHKTPTPLPTPAPDPNDPGANPPGSDPNPSVSPTPSVPPGNDAPECSRSYDMMLVLDESGSIIRSDFGEAKRFARLVADSLLDSEADSRLGVITFSSDAKLHLPLTDDLTYALQIIDGFGQRKGGTNISAGFRSAGQELESRGRADIPDTVIMVTDGGATVGGNPEGEANTLKSKGVRIFTVHVGQNPQTRKATERLSSGPESFFDMESFAQLPETFVNQLYNTLCRGSLPPVTPPSPTATPTPRPAPAPGDGPIQNPL